MDGRNYGEDVVKRYFNERQETVFSLISTKRSELNEIFGFISNAEQHKRLFEYVRTRKDFLKCNPHTKQRAVDTFVEFLYKVRNNMFHSVKEWDEPSEALFLTRVNPILKDLLKGLIRAES